ncbi:dTDP-4-dehydrorhamnose reductase [uncultured Schumannella sp.]|uniref:dTDP-4-dehydrorhamnose reductase n=1 Tax=uncultured Schumannella sp. TaxID=1195956 RepID=UPI000C57EF66|nr:dTDP-4-dehydrorhamnose reductase [uncultured Schumannella sp.]MAT18211.1 dTDP-4-dehydrorhamnose reductase [Leifsonia sp.]|tara:strand:- start:59256 stop:60119 length:864 start_codon:yes stop_codon:yes gene_type:complete
MTVRSDARWLVTGAHGLLGRELVAALAGRQVTARGRSELDITDPDAIADAISGADVVLNAAAYTAVDAAEYDEDGAFAANALGAENVARAAALRGARLVHVSTDYVFDGRATSAYRADAPPSPINAYGRTKAEGERRVMAASDGRASIVRTAWLYGGPGDFPHAVLAAARTGRPLRGADDQIGQPTWARDLAKRIVELADRPVPGGIYHGTNSGQTSRREFMRAILEDAGLGHLPVESARAIDFAMPAARPAWSVLDHASWDAAGLTPMRGWREALGDAARAQGWAA